MSVARARDVQASQANGRAAREPVRRPLADDLPLRLRWGADARLSRLSLRLRWAARAAVPASGGEAANPARRSCFLCTTWRSGSTFLGDALHAAAGMDLSHEPFFLNRQQAPLGAVLRGRSLRRYLDWIIADRTSPQGLIGVKVMWVHFRAVLRGLRGIRELRYASELEVLRSVFPDPVFVFLTRSDKVRQAISFYRADSTKVWHRDRGGKLYTTPGPARSEPEYDYERIRAARDRICTEEQRWRDFFHRNGVQPLELTYEEVCEDLPGVVGRVLERLGDDVTTERLERAHSRYVKLADATTEEWVERFLADSANAPAVLSRRAFDGAGRSLGLRRHFLVIGAQRAGTTWLYRNLKPHPDIWLPPAKEVHFFDRSERYSTPSYHNSPPGWPRVALALAPSSVRGMVRKYLHSGEWMRTAARHPWSAAWFSLSYPFATIDAEWYRRLFILGGDRITGDITPGYSLLTDEDVALARELLPDARIVMVLRDPIERAWSNYKLDCRTRGLDVKDELAARTFFSRYDVFMRGDYATILPRWRARFGEDRVHVAYYDDLAADPDAFLRGVLEFLGARADLPLSILNQRINTSAAVDLPDGIRALLARQYHDSLRRLSAMEPGRAHDWLREAERVMT